MQRREAAEFGTSEIGLAVMATTFSIVAVFVPVAFMHGIIGRFFYQFGMTVTVRRAHLAVRVVHADADAVVAHADDARDVTGAIFRAIEAALNGVDRSYRGLLGWSLRHRLDGRGRLDRSSSAPASSCWRSTRESSSCRTDDESQFSVTLRTETGLVARGDRRGDAAGRGDAAQEPARARPLHDDRRRHARARDGRADRRQAARAERTRPDAGSRSSIRSARELKQRPRRARVGRGGRAHERRWRAARACCR